MYVVTKKPPLLKSADFKDECNTGIWNIKVANQ